MRILATGALAGWKRETTEHGIVLTVQVAEKASDFDRREFAHVNVTLNDRQLRSLARDLQRAAGERGIELASEDSTRSKWTAGLFFNRRTR